MRRLASGLLLACISTAALAALHFPALTGRVVDDAHILSPQTVDALDQKLAGYERGTSNQVVVVTLSSLQGTSIEDYGYQLGRAWGIGQKGKDNGVLLMVVPGEHRVRIEVGYGLEGVLTDAISSEITNGIIIPAFKGGDMERGIVDGTDAILAALGGKSIAVEARAPPPSFTDSPIFGFLIFGLILFLIIRYPTAAYIILSSTRVGGSSFSGSGYGGGFSGGGGSFGGGGASGSW